MKSVFAHFFCHDNPVTIILMRTNHLLAYFLLSTGLIAVAGSPTAAAPQENKSSEVAMAAYADAANFQTNGAIDLAINGWKKFLKEHPDHKLVSSANHYLGVCYMQQQAPDYRAASDAFGRALRDRKYDLREESLANRGWCLYASSGVYDDADPPKLDEGRLRETIETFKTLVSENPKSRFADRAYFYSGEASYDLGEATRAITFYDKLLTLKSAKDSPLRCEALYSRGVAFEEMDQVDKAVGSFRQLIDQYQDNDLAVDAQLRLGDLLIMQKDYRSAITALEKAAEASSIEDDKAYARFRRAFALVQAGDAGKAAQEYARVASEFPKSEYAGAATLAAAQSSYRAGDMKSAAQQFRRVLAQNSPQTATEAAHWLARIELSKGNASEAAAIAKKQIDSGTSGEFEVALKLDLAEALSMDPQQLAKSMEMFDYVYRTHRDHPLAARTLYNVAFTALQLSQYDKAFASAGEFLERFGDDTLRSDVTFIRGESLMLSGKSVEATEVYKRLLAEAERSNVQRPLWVLRAATAMNLAGLPDQTIELVKREMPLLSLADQKAEARFLLGQALLAKRDSAAAAEAFESVSQLAPNWTRSSEALILAGQAKLVSGDKAAAKRMWEQVAREHASSRMGDQAQYKLAQVAGSGGDFGEAVKRYEAILKSGKDPALKPFVTYGRSWALMQQKDYAKSIAGINQLIAEYPQHALVRDGLLTRGICYRNEEEFGPARQDLEKFMATNPVGINLGHALYELALIDQKEKDLPAAASRLKELVEKVPNYPGMDKVLYELGWSLRERGEQAEANRYFAKLIDEYPDNPLSAESAYFVGQSHYANKDWRRAREFFKSAADSTKDPELLEKSLYRLGWSHFKTNDLGRAEEAFDVQSRRSPDGRLAMDALMMVGECRFKKGRYEDAIKAYGTARKKIAKNGDTAKSVIDDEERQVRELVLLHGGQCAAQLKRWDDAISWYDDLRNRFPSTDYLPHVYYELGYAHQQKGDLKRAVGLFEQVADNYRNEIAARARFMIGEIRFAQKQYDKAIPDFQRVMFGFGAEKAPADIKNWQAKSAFEAGRCGQRLIEQAKTDSARQKAKQITRSFFEYVVDKHSNHELAGKSRQQLATL